LITFKISNFIKNKYHVFNNFIYVDIFQINMKESKDKIKEDLEVAKSDEKIQSTDEDDEPSWYHYLIVILIFVGIFFVFYGIYYIYEISTNSNSSIGDNVLYMYPYKVGNITYNIYFEKPLQDIKNDNYIVEPSKYDMLNTVSYTLVFMDYNGTDNGEIAKASTKLVSFLKTVYTFSFYNESFIKYPELTCDNSTLTDKIIIFNPYSEKTGIYYNTSNGCIEFLSENNASVMVNLLDKMMYNLVVEE